MFVTFSVYKTYEIPAISCNLEPAEQPKLTHPCYAYYLFFFALNDRTLNSYNASH